MKCDTSEEGNTELEDIAIKVIQMKHKKLPIKKKWGKHQRNIRRCSVTGEPSVTTSPKMREAWGKKDCPEDIGWEIPKSDKKKLKSYIFIKLNKQMYQCVRVLVLKQQC